MKWPKTHFRECPHCNPHWKQPRCGVTGWTNFSAIFLFLLSIIHNLATIATVPVGSDNFLICTRATYIISDIKLACQWKCFLAYYSKVSFFPLLYEIESCDGSLPQSLWWSLKWLLERKKSPSPWGVYNPIQTIEIIIVRETYYCY